MKDETQCNHEDHIVVHQGSVIRQWYRAFVWRRLHRVSFSKPLFWITWILEPVMRALGARTVDQFSVVQLEQSATHLVPNIAMSTVDCLGGCGYFG